jgi:hypothetical protein
MGLKSYVGLASLLLVGAALSGCRSDDSWRGQSSGLSNAGISRPWPTNPNTSPAARPWGSSSTMTNQPGMSPNTMGIQQTGGVQPSANATGMPSLSNSGVTTNPVGNPRAPTYSDNAPSSPISRQTDLTAPALPSSGRTDRGQPVGQDPVPPTPPNGTSSSDQGPGAYSMPAPKPFSSSSNSDVKTRAPGDDN